jgi:hypothetical protein
MSNSLRIQIHKSVSANPGQSQTLTSSFHSASHYGWSSGYMSSNHFRRRASPRF